MSDNKIHAHKIWPSAHFIRIQIHAFYLSVVHGDPQEWLKLKAFGVVKVNENIGSNVTD